MKKKVRAAVMVKPGKIEIREFPYPSVDEDSLLIKMEMCGICGTDKHTYRGETTQHGGTEAETTTPFPIIPGHEIVGKVAEVGKRAKKAAEFDGKELSVGDRVTMHPDIVCGKCYYCKYVSGFPLCENIKGYGNAFSCDEPPHLFGGCSEYIYVIPGVHIFKVPENMSPKLALLTELMTVTFNLDKAREFYSISSKEGFGAGDTVVIQGIGPMGMLHVVKSRILGAGDIIAVDRSEFRLKMAKKFGADYTINVSKTTEKERINQIRELTDGRGADLVVECTGVAESIPEGLEITRRGGMYLVAGVFVDVGEVSINPHRHLAAKHIRLIGLTDQPVSSYTPSLKIMDRFKNTFPFEEIITHEYKIEDAEQAFQKSMDAESSMKVVVTP